MPRSRRRHHSRSRSRSRSHSHERDREPKRRKIDNVDSPAHKRSLSCEPPSPVNDDKEKEKDEEREEKPMKQIEDKFIVTPKKTLSPRQMRNKLESERKRQQKQEEKERIKRERLQMKREKEEERLKIKQEKEELKCKKAKERELKEEQKRKEKEEKEELKRKEKEEKEAKRKEKEEREEAKRKEKMRKQQEIDEKNREKQKMKEQKQKAAQAFVNFFVAKKAETKAEESKATMFMPFEVKSDMRLAPTSRRVLSDEEKENLEEVVSKLDDDGVTYLNELKTGKRVAGRSGKTWPYEEDVVIVEEDFGESICEDKQKLQKMRVKFLKFHENKRPPYYGTWRKKGASIKARRPFAEDKAFFDYEIDSDDDWEEEEEQGESLNGSDDEDKENEIENDDYEVDNEFFVPHGHLSDDEVDDEAVSKLSPESLKQKLKLLKDEFDEDMQTKTNKLKPRSIGCVWYNKDGSNVDEATDRYLRPLAMITNGRVIIKKRQDPAANTTPMRKNAKELCQELIPIFLKHINQNSNRKSVIVEDFIGYMQKNGYSIEVSKAHLVKRLKEFAQWKKCAREGSMFNKYCWVVEEDVKKKYNVE